MKYCAKEIINHKVSGKTIAIYSNSSSSKWNYLTRNQIMIGEKLPGNLDRPKQSMKDIRAISSPELSCEVLPKKGATHLLNN